MLFVIISPDDGLCVCVFVSDHDPIVCLLLFLLLLTPINQKEGLLYGHPNASQAVPISVPNSTLPALSPEKNVLQRNMLQTTATTADDGYKIAAARAPKNKPNKSIILRAHAGEP